jgi:hypothetical protein
MSLMKETVPIYILLSPEIREFLADNQTSLAELLHEEGVEVEAQIAANPVHQEGGSTKDPVSILVASAAVLAALTPLVSRVLDRFSRKPTVVEEQVLLPVLDGSGAPVTDKDGQPYTYWALRPKVLKDEKPKPMGSIIELQGPFGLKVSYKDM